LTSIRSTNANPIIAQTENAITVLLMHDCRAEAVPFAAVGG
jgi:hypothetical protein